MGSSLGSVSRLRAVVVAAAFGAGAVTGVGAAPALAVAIPCTAGALVTAIEAANADPAASTIELAPNCVYTFSGPYLASSGWASWYGPSALPAIASDITIEGNGARIERVGLTPFRLLFVGADSADADTFGYPSPGAGVLKLRDLTLSGGLALSLIHI